MILCTPGSKSIRKVKPFVLTYVVMKNNLLMKEKSLFKHPMNTAFTHYPKQRFHTGTDGAVSLEATVTKAGIMSLVNSIWCTGSINIT